MKSLLAFFACLALSFSAYGQGQVTFANTSLTLISADGTLMPVSGTQQFIFAVFRAPSTTVSIPGQPATLTDPAFQLVSAYNTNSSVAVGRIVNRANVDMGPTVGTVVDYLVRGWSANAGTTWDEARTSWNNGNPLVPMFIGSSVIGNDPCVGRGNISNSNIILLRSAGLQYDFRARAVHAHAGWSWSGGNVVLTSALALIPGAW